ncbi:hypothetical protein F2Q69_00047638 [Brassica cretica]|uniref:Uncharacterized protein n=1 Tax=Brassica cretica TaxID=69181 RepID=A0A8S9PY01_BRACR|nr:hypothetical protein F2Q69_00047638 [Brassica cretica]
MQPLFFPVATVYFLAVDAHPRLRRSPLLPPSSGIFLVCSVLNKEDETAQLRDSFLAACAADLGGATCGSWWFTGGSCAFLGCEDCPDSGEGAVNEFGRFTPYWWLLSFPLVSSSTWVCGLAGCLWFGLQRRGLTW